MLERFSRSRSSYPLLKSLSLLLDAGIPLSKAVERVGQKGSIDFKEKILAGGAFADALDPATLPSNVIAAIRAGEKGGRLAESVSRACRSIEMSSSFRKKLAGSLAYPAFVMAVCGVSLIVAGSVMIPSFSGMLSSMGVALPMLSRFLLSVFRFMPLILLSFAVLAAASVKLILSDIGLNFPVIGRLRLKGYSSAFFRSMSEMLNAGSGMAASLEVSVAAVGSRKLREALYASKERVLEGASLTEALEKTGIFDTTSLYLIGAGESSSSLEKVFDQLASKNEEEIENDLKTLSSLIEPVSTLAVGLVVAIIVLGMFMPVIKLVGAFGG